MRVLRIVMMNDRCSPSRSHCDAARQGNHFQELAASQGRIHAGSMHFTGHSGSLRGILADGHGDVRINQNATGFQFRFDLPRCLIGSKAGDLNISEYDEIDFARLTYARRTGKFGGIENFNVELIAGADCDLWRLITPVRASAVSARNRPERY